MAQMYRNAHPAPVPHSSYTSGQNYGPIPKPLFQGYEANYQGATGVVLTWDLPGVPHGIIQSFEVQFYMETDVPSNSSLWKQLLHTILRSYPRTVFISLPPKHIYHFILRAQYGNNFWGPFSDPVSVTLWER